MEYFKISDGKDSHGVSRIILGTWAMGGTGWGGSDSREAVEAVRESIARGVNAVDTAPAYGSGLAEELVGEAVSGMRDSVFIATKCGLDLENGMRHNLRPEAIFREAEASLRRLGTDRIDLYQCHWPDPSVPAEDVMGAMTRLKEAGKIRFIGLSNYSVEQAEESGRYAVINSMQYQYSLLERGIEDGILPWSIKNGIPLLAYGPLGGGLLTGKYDSPPHFPRNDARSFFYRFYREMYREAAERLVSKLRDVSERARCLPSQAAAAWALSAAGVGAVIIGARNRRQAAENSQLPAMDVFKEFVPELNAASAGFREVYVK